LLSCTAFGGIALIQKGLLINTSWTFVSEVLIATVSYYLKFREQFKLRQQIKKQFETYLDPRQVKRLQNNPDLLKLGGELRYCTFLFTDVRGFTALSEKLSPQEVSKIMNLVLTAQTDAVQKHGGMIDKFIGDAMMAIFNAPIDLVEHENAAYLAAVDIKNNLEDVNRRLKDMNLPQIAIGLGINSGNAVLGNMGSDTRFDYSAIGDAVNVAARFESGTKVAGVEILIGASTAQKLDFELQSLEPIEAKGKSEKLQVYTWDIN
jgi:adenylate cyclase